MNSKFERELSELLEQNIITSDTAQKITAYYHTKEEAKPNRLFTIFGVLGALLSGLGVILIIAHNWDEMPKNLKTIFAFLPLIIGQISCAYSFIKKKGGAWIESSATFLILSVGATISLVSQIYNIPGNFSNFLLVWIAITAPLMYLLRSNIAVLLHLVLITWYACELGYGYRSPMPWWYLPLLAWVVPYYIRLQKQEAQSNIAGVLNWLLPLSPIIVLGTFTSGDISSFLMYLGLFGLLYNLGELPQFKNQKLRRNGYTVMGSLGTITILMVLTFEWFWKDATRDSYEQINIMLTSIPFLAAFAVLIYVHLKKHVKTFNLFQYAFLVVGILYLTNHLGYIHNIILTNILVAALGLFAIRIGINKSSYAILNYGLLTITVLIVCRFFDTNLDFIIRGILFISVGAGFFFANYLLLKKQRKSVLENNTKEENNA
ncbi:DUF2157 domain-containing protein [uncultured Croceitalea sp.]|uniref:DUF2157 domain-containing protein n=1 Tax=uncultured Croceitalea sp. TaxID=1798908 RepID=UPI0033068732